MHDKLKGYYERMDIVIVPVFWGTIILSLLLDLCPLPYASDLLEDVFDYDCGNIVSISLVIWTFITILFTYYLGRMNEKSYGVRLIDVLDWENVKTKKFRNRVVLFVSEMVILILITILEWPITMGVLAFLQFITMMYALLTLYVKISKQTVVEKAKRDFIQIMSKAQGIKQADLKMLHQKRVLLQMISNLDYSNEEEADILLGVLCAKEGNGEFKKLCAQKADVGELCKYVLRYLVRLIMNSAREEELYLFVNNWIFSANVLIELKCQILFPFIERGKTSDFEYCEAVLLSLPGEQQRKLLIFCIECNEYLYGKVNQSYRNYYTEQLKEKLTSELTDEEEKYKWKVIENLRKE